MSLALWPMAALIYTRSQGRGSAGVAIPGRGGNPPFRTSGTTTDRLGYRARATGPTRARD